MYSRSKNNTDLGYNLISIVVIVPCFHNKINTIFDDDMSDFPSRLVEDETEMILQSVSPVLNFLQSDR